MSGTDQLIARITNAGLAAVAGAHASGRSVEITHIALGRGRAGAAPAYDATGTETALAREMLRVPVASGEVIETGVILLQAMVAAGGPAQGWAYELGLFLDDGTLFALSANADAPLLYVSGAEDLLLAQTVAISALPAGSVMWNASGPSVNLTLAGPLAQIAEAVIALQTRAFEDEIAPPPAVVVVPGAPPPPPPIDPMIINNAVAATLTAAIPMLKTDIIAALDVPAAASAAVAAARDDLVDEIADQIGDLGRLFWIDAANGSDAASGTAVAPLKSLERALALTPHGGWCEARLLGPYTIARTPGGPLDFAVTGRKHLHITSANATRYLLTWANYAAPAASVPLAFSDMLLLRSFTATADTSVRITGLSVVVPNGGALDHDDAAQDAQAIFKARGGNPVFELENCDLTLATMDEETRIGGRNVISFGRCVTFSVHDVTYLPERQAIETRFIRSEVHSLLLTWLTTNLQYV